MMVSAMYMSHVVCVVMMMIWVNTLVYNGGFIYPHVGIVVDIYGLRVHW